MNLLIYFQCPAHKSKAFLINILTHYFYVGIKNKNKKGKEVADLVSKTKRQFLILFFLVPTLPLFLSSTFLLHLLIFFLQILFLLLLYYLYLPIMLKTYLSSSSISSILSQIQLIEYTLLIDTPSLQNQTLTHHLTHHHVFSQQNKLFSNVLDKPQAKPYVKVAVPSPNLYIQKLRGIYYLILHEVYVEKESQFLPAFSMLHLLFYISGKTELVRKKYLCQFLQFLSYDKGNKGAVQQNLNKYPLMDEILIDVLIELIEEQENISADDNFNIVKFLKDLGIDAEALTISQIRLNHFLLKSSQNLIEVVQLEKERVTEEERCSTAEISLEEDLDSSSVLPFSRENLFAIENSYINRLNSLILQEGEKEAEENQDQQDIFDAVAKEIEEASHPPIKILNESFRKEKREQNLIREKGKLEPITKIRGIKSDQNGILKYRSMMKIVEVSSPRSKQFFD